MASSSSVMPNASSAPIEARSSGRQRTGNSKYSGGAFEEITEVALRAYSKSLPKIGQVKKKSSKSKEQEKQKGPVEIVIGGEAVAPGAYSVAVVQRKKPAKRKPKVVAPIDVKLSKLVLHLNIYAKHLIRHTAMRCDAARYARVLKFTLLYCTTPQ